MKYLDLTGTTSNSFKIGVGENSTELRVIDGVLHYRNYGDNYKPLNFGSAQYVLSPVAWKPNTVYEAGNLVYYSGVLFSVLRNHTSSGFFLSQNDVYRKVADVENFTTVNTELQSSKVLTQLDSSVLQVVGNVTGNFNLKLPDPTSVRLGTSYEVRNDSSKVVSVVSWNNLGVTTLHPNNTVRLTLTNTVNSYDGWVWNYYSTPPEVNFGLQRVQYNFASGVAVPLFGASGVFSVDHSGAYNFFDTSDATTAGTLYYTSGGSQVSVVTFSLNVVSGDTTDKLCFFNSNEVLYVKNSTNTTKSVVFHKNF